MRGRSIGLSRGIAVGLVVMVLCGLLCLGCKPRGSVKGTTQVVPAPPVLFFGHVADQDGRPVEGVEVVVRPAELIPNPVMVGAGNVPSDARTFSVYTNDRGDFLVNLPAGHNDLEIQDVRKAEYDWVKDWAWQIPAHRKENTLAFQFPGRFVKCPIYVPDAKNPAVLPLHRRGSEKAVWRPSRGGADVDCAGNRVVNGPVTPAIPSAGPGAPRGEAEIEAAIRGRGETPGKR